MATVVNFSNKRIIEPGVYAKTESKVPVQPSTATYGNVILIDTGSGATWGGGSGVSGEFSNGLKSVYSFNDPNDARDFVKGGLHWDLIDYLFNPTNQDKGIDSLFLVRAATTTGASAIFNFVGSGSNGGSVTIKTKNEGKVGNGLKDETLGKSTIVLTGPVAIGDIITATVTIGANPAITLGTFTTTTTVLADARNGLLAAIQALTPTHGYVAVLQGTNIVIYAPEGSGAASSAYVNAIPITGTGTITATFPSFTGGANGTKLIKGYGAQMKAGIIDTAKFIVEFTLGTYHGTDQDGDDYGFITKQQANPIVVATSSEFDNIETFINWMKTDFDFAQSFVLSTFQINGTGSVTTADLTTYTSINLFSGGTEVYNSTDLDKVLDSIKELDNTWFLCDKYQSDAKGTQNTKILTHIKNDAEFSKFMVVGGGKDQTAFTGSSGSIGIAQYFDSTIAIVVHSGDEFTKPDGSGTKRLDTIYVAANVLGRIAGLEPQTPATFKNIKLKNPLHLLTKSQREIALQSGVLHLRDVAQKGMVINQAINSLQKNTQLINQDGTSFEISIMRIAAQLNKELSLNLRAQFIGGNLNTASPSIVKNFIEGYLLTRTATTITDNLILRFENVVVKQKQDYYDISYGFVPNGPLNKMFVTGFMLDANLSA